MIGYPLEPLQREVAYLGLHLHWSYEALMQMEHRDRRQWVREVNRLRATRES